VFSTLIRQAAATINTSTVGIIGEVSGLLTIPDRLWPAVGRVGDDRHVG
jgi:hypothetical protein